MALLLSVLIEYFTQDICITSVTKVIGEIVLVMKGNCFPKVKYVLF